MGFNKRAKALTHNLVVIAIRIEDWTIAGLQPVGRWPVDPFRETMESTCTHGAWSLLLALIEPCVHTRNAVRSQGQLLIRHISLASEQRQEGELVGLFTLQYT